MTMNSLNSPFGIMATAFVQAKELYQVMFLSKLKPTIQNNKYTLLFSLLYTAIIMLNKSYWLYCITQQKASMKS